MAERMVTLRVKVWVNDDDEDALVSWAESTYASAMTRDEAYDALARETLFLGERYARDEEELERVGFQITIPD